MSTVHSYNLSNGLLALPRNLFRQINNTTTAATFLHIFTAFNNLTFGDGKELKSTKICQGTATKRSITQRLCH